MGCRKPFDRALFEANDLKARNKIKELFGDRYLIEDNPKKMGVDLLFKDKTTGELLFYVETEIKACWVKEEFPYTDINFPSRKAKYAILEKPTVFLMFSKDMSHFLTVKSLDLLNSPKSVVPNKYVAYGEEFYKIPIEKVSFDKMEM
jgi:hypothetical protein